MSIKKFKAPTARQAMKEIRDMLGADAMILSNRQTEYGVEIVAIAHNDIANLTDGPLARKPRLSVPSELPVISADEWTRSVEDAYLEQTVQPVAKNRQPLQFDQPHLSGKQAEPMKPRTAAPDPTGQQTILSEIKSMSAMLQHQFAALYWNNVQLHDPQRSTLLRKMLNAGFSTSLAHQMLDNMPAGNIQGETWIKQVFKRNLQVASKQDDIIAKGGVYALIGPTGVGKTTTTAKLAARAVVRYGAAKVALLTTDSYRIAAYEQLKIYGKILGVAVHAVKDTDDLRLTLSALRHKHLVLIDTVGMGQRDERVTDQNEMFDATNVACLLLLNATSSGGTLDDVVRMYRSDKVIGCIPTKLDEAVNIGSLLDVAVRHRLKMHYMANGQRVPEDLHPANIDYMLHRAFKQVATQSPFALHELDFPVLMAGAQAKEPTYAL
jgi:flagellar biosynthesis protein FlhF